MRDDVMPEESNFGPAQRRVTRTMALIALGSLLVIGCYRRVPVSDANDGQTARDEAGDAPDIVTPAFDWPENLHLRATAHHRVIRNNEPLVDEAFDFRVRYRADEGATKQTGDISTTVPSTLSSAHRQLVPTAPFEIDGRGHIIRFHDEDDGEAQDGQTAGRSRQTELWWRELVELWADRRIEIDRTVAVGAEAPIRLPVVGDKPMRLDVEIDAARADGCPGVPETCLRLTIRRRPHVHQLRDHLQAWVEHYARNLSEERNIEAPPTLSVVRVYTEFETRLWTDATTLVPLRSESDRLLRMTLEETETEAQRSWKQRETLTINYTAGRQ